MQDKEEEVIPNVFSLISDKQVYKLIGLLIVVISQFVHQQVDLFIF